MVGGAGIITGIYEAGRQVLGVSKGRPVFGYSDTHGVGIVSFGMLLVGLVLILDGFLLTWLEDFLSERREDIFMMSVVSMVLSTGGAFGYGFLLLQNRTLQSLLFHREWKWLLSRILVWRLSHAEQDEFLRKCELSANSLGVGDIAGVLSGAVAAFVFASKYDTILDSAHIWFLTIVGACVGMILGACFARLICKTMKFLLLIIIPLSFVFLIFLFLPDSADIEWNDLLKTFLLFKWGEFLTMILGTLLFGVLFSLFIGVVYTLFYAPIIGIAFGSLLSSGRMLGSLVQRMIAPLMIARRFHLVLCAACLRLSHPQRCRYDEGRRFCEHCHANVREADAPEKVVAIFGECAVPFDQKQTRLDNPDFEDREQPIDLAEVHLVPKTTDRRLFERFLTFIVNFPPERGIASVRIVCYGALDELGSHLGNAVRNTFQQIEVLSGGINE